MQDMATLVGAGSSSAGRGRWLRVRKGPCGCVVPASLVSVCLYWRGQLGGLGEDLDAAWLQWSLKAFMEVLAKMSALAPAPRGLSIFRRCSLRLAVRHACTCCSMQLVYQRDLDHYIPITHPALAISDDLRSSSNTDETINSLKYASRARLDKRAFFLNSRVHSASHVCVAAPRCIENEVKTNMPGLKSTGR